LDSELYIVELRTRGLFVGVSKVPEERILTTVFRLGEKERNKVLYLRFKFYRSLDKLSVLTLFGEKYVVPRKYLPEVERVFSEVYGEFLKVRREAYSKLVDRWDEVRKRLEDMGIPPEKILRIKPSDESFLDIYYVVTPLSVVINGFMKASEELEGEGDEYRVIAGRVRDEAERILNEVRRGYEEKVKELEKVVEELRKSPKNYRLRFKALDLMSDAEEIAKFLGITEDFRKRVEPLKEYLGV